MPATVALPPFEKTSSPDATLPGASVAPAQDHDEEMAAVETTLSWKPRLPAAGVELLLLCAGARPATEPATTRATSASATGRRRTSANVLAVHHGRPVDVDDLGPGRAQLQLGTCQPREGP